MEPNTPGLIASRFRLDGKVAIVTGASKGIGAAIARGLAEFGAKVVVSSRRQEAVDEVAAELRAAGLDAIAIACHVGDSAQLANLVQQTVATCGGLDIVVNNAAINPVFATLDSTDTAIFDKIMAINVRAPFELSNLAYPHLQARGGGSIIHISSVEGLKPDFGLGLYSVSKAALIMLAQNQAKEWGREKVRVNVICPGLVKTKFSAALWQNETILEKLESHLPLGRMAAPEEMAGLAVFLASEAASYCTGGIYTADGGHMLG